MAELLRTTTHLARTFVDGKCWLMPSRDVDGAGCNTPLIGDNVGSAYYLTQGLYSGCYIEYKYVAPILTLDADLLAAFWQNENSVLVWTLYPLHPLPDANILVRCTPDSDPAIPAGTQLLALYNPAHPEFVLVIAGDYKNHAVKRSNIELILS